MDSEARWDPSDADVERLLTDGGVIAHFQPIVAIGDGAIIGYEALARMPEVDGNQAGPDRWLAAAERIGRRTELELACIQAAIAHGLPPGSALLFVNVSPLTLGDPWALHLLEGRHHRIVLELSEVHVVDDYEALRQHLWSWTSRGARLAIDDTGSGYASLRHVLQLRPDFIKLDRSLISGIGSDTHRRALADALVAFAQGLGAEVIAEGVEDPSELAILRVTPVSLVQGYLLARPGPPWPAAADPTESSGSPAASPHTRAELELAVNAATDARLACDAVVAYLAALGDLMPSAYLLQGDRLRCQAQRGIWQVLDGMAPGAGVTGRCYLDGVEILLQDVHESDVYREAIPGVSAELCVPLRVEGLVVGALNVESRSEIHDEIVIEVRHCAAVLGERLAVVGRAPLEGPLDQIGFHVRRVAEAHDLDTMTNAVLDGARRLATMNSALVTVVDVDGVECPVGAIGPLAERLMALEAGEGALLADLVDRMTSCYTSGTSLDRGFIGLDRLRNGGVRSLAVVPMHSGGRRLGLLIVAHTSPTSLSTREVEPLEVLAAQVAGRLLPLGARSVDRRGG